MNFAARNKNASRRKIEFEIPDAEHCRGCGVSRLRGSPKYRAEPGQQFADGEWFVDEVVSARIQCVDLVAFSRANREDDDVNISISLPYSLDDVNAVTI